MAKSQAGSPLVSVQNRSLRLKGHYDVIDSASSHNTIDILLSILSFNTVIALGFSSSYIARDPSTHYDEKPVALIERAIHNSSKAGDIVFDLFGALAAR